MNIPFYKYQGTGNDFVIIDNRKWTFTALTTEQVKLLCDRRFGIGADGLMLLQNKEGCDFDMKYYNADGRLGSMCGNGGRCMIKLVYDLGMRKKAYTFLASDGLHEATIDENGIVSLKMKDVHNIRNYNGDFLVDTGSPHYVKFASDVMDMDVFRRGMEIRYSPAFAQEGINVNFVEQRNDGEIFVRTYERGVEDETLSCGTGVTASALVCFHNQTGMNDVNVLTRGGKLTVRYNRIDDSGFSDIWLRGPAEKVFGGDIDLKP